MTFFTNKFITFFIILAACFLARPVLAANVFFDGETHTAGQGSQFTVDIVLDTQADSINALQGTVAVPGNVAVREIRDGNSIVSFWINAPAKDQSGNIAFSGIMPGGYEGKRGKLFSLLLDATAPGAGSLDITGLSVLKNDGKGTAATAGSGTWDIVVSAASPGQQQSAKAPQDTAPPEHFTPTISKTPDAFDGKWFLVFSTQDKVSGVGHYEVKEGYFGAFHAAQSPYVLKNQNADQEIFIKAVDKNGNVRLEVVYPAGFIPWYKNYWILGIILVVLGICGYVTAQLLWKKSKK